MKDVNQTLPARRKSYQLWVVLRQTKISDLYRYGDCRFYQSNHNARLLASVMNNIVVFIRALVFGHGYQTKISDILAVSLAWGRLKERRQRGHY